MDMQTRDSSNDGQVGLDYLSEVAGGMYFKQKAIVKRTLPENWAELEDLRSGDLLKMHQSNLRCVVPVVSCLLVRTSVEM